jgi:ADP-ribose pyrophosphatase YjhB (NUDIX family)
MDLSNFEPPLHCSHCGAFLPPGLSWPKTCGVCERITYLNPIPVVAIVLPVDEGVLGIVRGNEPAKGAAALVGGYIEGGETAEDAARRELAEEIGISVPHAPMRLVGTWATSGNRLVIGCHFDVRLRERDLPSFVPNAEVRARLMLRQPRTLAFVSHTSLLHWFLRGRHGAD